MDAHSTVTAEEGDRYPLGPPSLRCIHIMVIIPDCLSGDGSSILPCIAKFCKCQQENVMLSRFLRRTKTVEGDGFNSQPLARVVSVTETNWTSIPSDVPSPARVYYTGEWLL